MYLKLIDFLGMAYEDPECICSLLIPLCIGKEVKVD